MSAHNSPNNIRKKAKEASTLLGWKSHSAGADTPKFIDEPEFVAWLDDLVQEASTI